MSNCINMCVFILSNIQIYVYLIQKGCKILNYTKFDSIRTHTHRWIDRQTKTERKRERETERGGEKRLRVWGWERKRSRININITDKYNSYYITATTKAQEYAIRNIINIYRTLVRWCVCIYTYVGIYVCILILCIYYVYNINI